MFLDRFVQSGKLVDADLNCYYWQSGKLYKINDENSFDHALAIVPGKRAYVAIGFILLSVLLAAVVINLHLPSYLKTIIIMAPVLVALVSIVAWFRTIQKQHLVRVEADETLLQKLKYQRPELITRYLWLGIIMFAASAVILLLSRKASDLRVVAIGAFFSLYYLAAYYSSVRRFRNTADKP